MKKCFVVALSVILALQVLCTASFAFALVSGTHELYVSPDGSDENDGSFDSPLRTPLAAKEKLRQLGGTGYTVLFREGSYFLPEALEFSAADMADVIYRAYGNERVVFTGASPVTGFTQETVNGVKAFVKQLDTSENGWYFNSLFNGETMLKTPRYPETGYFTVASADKSDALAEPLYGTDIFTNFRAFYASPSDVGTGFRNLSDVVVRVLHYWKDDMMFVTSLDTTTGKIGLSRPTSMTVRDIDRFFFENVFEALNEPGEWYLDRQLGKLYYIPFEGETADTLTLYSSKNTALVSIDGADGISFEGITFCNTAWELAVSEDNSYLAENLMDSTQAAYDVKGAFRVKNADRIAVKNCDFLNLGSTAIKMQQNVTDSTVESCFF